MMDRQLAAKFAIRAVDLLIEGKSQRAGGIKNNEIIDYDIVEAVKMKRKFNNALYEQINILSL